MILLWLSLQYCIINIEKHYIFYEDNYIMFQVYQLHKVLLSFYGEFHAKVLTKKLR